MKMRFCLCQGKYVVEILKKFRMMDCKVITTPMESNLKLMCYASSESIDAMMYHQMISSLMYMMNTRPNICFVVNTLSNFLVNLRHVHLIDSKHVLRYLKGTMDYGLKYDVNQKINLHGYVDLDWVGSCFSLGSDMISWFTKCDMCGHCHVQYIIDQNLHDEYIYQIKISI